MAATSKEQLLEVTRKDFDRLASTLAEIEEAAAKTPHPEDGITILDTVNHRKHWIDLFLGWYRDGVAGKEVSTPAPGYKWNQLKEYNAKVRERMRKIRWKKAVADLHKAHDELVALIDSLPEEELYGPKKYDWTNNWTVGRWAEASGPSHYRSARKYVREILRKTGA